MDVFSLYATDPVTEEKGREFTEEFGGEATFLIARSGNRTYNRMVQKQFDAHRHILQLKGTEEEEDRAEQLSFELVGKVMAKAILLGWSGKVQYKGVDFPYSYENAVTLLSHKEFRNKIAGLADNFRNYLQAQKEADEKNSGTTSGGSSPGVAASAV